jgi:hypothetical protein
MDSSRNDDDGEDLRDRKRAPVTDCYGCLGTGYIQWAGVKPGTECLCMYAKEGG